MARIYLGVGSNIERERYIVAGLDALQRMFGELEVSPVYDSEAVGFEGQPFLNLVVSADTDMPLAELATSLRHLEYEHGRPQNAQPNSPRQLDIDILFYECLVGVFDGVELPRGEILYNAFVLRPLADLAPNLVHPVAEKTIRELWRDYDQSSQSLRGVNFDWRGRQISSDSGE